YAIGVAEPTSVSVEAFGTNKIDIQTLIGAIRKTFDLRPKAIIQDLDLVLIMSVNPGFGGQSFIENTYKKVTQLKKLIEFSSSSAQIEIDGGVTDKNANALVEAGADVLVAGSFVFKSEDPASTIANLKAL
ncbi:MAG: methionine adenosyltransferase domain-containing protein, partial [Flavobacteriaceae bacterium]|nr:methionine adenosyltransferase domain-containing protein [Flavobacteriaceae bacterium]